MCDNTNNQNTVAITPKDIKELLQHFSKNTYCAKEVDPVANEVLQKSIELMKIDYNISLISNNNGELSYNYPNQLMVLECENAHVPTILVENPNLQAAQSTTDTIYESTYDTQKLRGLITKARLARCRARFPLPVILFKGKYICRSGTLSGGPEMYGRRGLDYFFNGPDDDDDIDSNQDTANPQSDWQLFDRVRSQDINLLKTFNVGTIIDFMVEKKKVKFGLNVTSSEKVDKLNRYSEFTIISVPYPGCEFFKEFKDSNYTAEGLVFDWSQGYVDADIRVPNNPITAQLDIEWDKYKDWDLILITQNYMRLILKYLQENNSGILIHCISGWDRTPLFISLLRLSLWADGVVHQELDINQILYLTISYDWMLFGHDLVNRISKGEEIFFFCFYVLKNLVDDDYSISGSQRHKTSKFSDPSSDKSVMLTNSDSHMVGMRLDLEFEGSNISFDSYCSSVSSKPQEQPPVGFNLREEIANEFPQRQESSSSLSVGSWQMITDTGSLRSSDSTSTVDSHDTNFNRCDGHMVFKILAVHLSMILICINASTVVKIAC